MINNSEKRPPCRGTSDERERMTKQVLAVCAKGSDALVKQRKDGAYKVYEIAPKAVGE